MISTYFFLLQTITAKAKQNPKINSFHRFYHNRFFKARNETSKRPLSGSLSLKILGRIRSSEIETLLFLYPIANRDVARLSSQQRVFLGTGSRIYLYFTLWGKVHSECFQFLVFPFPEEPLKLPFIFFGLLYPEREGGGKTKLERPSLIWAPLVLTEWIMKHVA